MILIFIIIIVCECHASGINLEGLIRPSMVFPNGTHGPQRPQRPHRSMKWEAVPEGRTRKQGKKGKKPVLPY